MTNQRLKKGQYGAGADGSSFYTSMSQPEESEPENSAQYLHILQDSERYLTHPTAQVQSQLTSNSHSPN